MISKAYRYILQSKSQNINLICKHHIGIFTYQNIHHYKLISTYILSDGVIQLYQSPPLFIQTPQLAVLVKSASQNKTLFTLRFSQHIQSVDDELTVLNWLNFRITFDQLAILMDILDESNVESIGLIDYKSFNNSTLKLYGKREQNYVKFKLQQDENDFNYQISMVEYSLLVCQMKNALPIVMGWEIPNEFLKQYVNPQSY